ncbi:MAG: hypothetical protein A2527_00975 [Candidatus Lambdaproteobacteria bacterium RIFOXYD2_FULL_50_16]|uniref:Amine oxidase domain-containing protein n=1 Tax=Candidatus Lambdaproteobacteria bacterium RIFOXYD2_FULL_50_16 TaxID=1817772 RepID=A0A1F6G9N4_9PROT|nr:MAG: hypothetical protein A2527_00975 [Candidatus Lambdaproteobacteria bacterium RIFOXYD2_FULL_50_16]
MPNEYDVIVVGSGIAGLFCANALLDQGKKVLLLEQHHMPGGYCTSIQRKGMTFDVGAHLIGSLGNPRTPVGRLIQQWELPVEFIRCNKLEKVHFPGLTIHFPACWEEFQATVASFFPDEAENLKKFWADLRKVMRSYLRPVEGNRMVEELHGQTYGEFLDVYFKSTKLKGILSSLYGYVGLAPNQISLFAMASMLGSYLIDGTYYVKGGSQKLSNALARRFKQAGGVLKYKEKVDNLLIENQRVVGVNSIPSGNFWANQVVYNGNLHQVLPAAQGGDYLLNIINQKPFHPHRNSVKLFSMYFGLRISEQELRRIQGFHFADFDLDQPENLLLYLAAPSLENKELSPKGTQILIANLPLRGESAELKFWSPENKAKFEKQVNEVLNKLSPGFAQRIVFQEGATPKTFFRYTCNDEGSVYGWAKTPEQMWVNPITKVGGLSQVGHWSYPGCGIAAVAVSGIHTAAQLSRT